jgi:hypothetical protein
MAYLLLRIFDVHLQLFYKEGCERAQRRLREEIQKSVKVRHCPSVTDVPHGNGFSISFNLSGVPESLHFVARDGVVVDMGRALRSDGSRCTVAKGLARVAQVGRAANLILSLGTDCANFFGLIVAACEH